MAFLNALYQIDNYRGHTAFFFIELAILRDEWRLVGVEYISEMDLVYYFAPLIYSF
jgi:hypothetical protein